MIGPRPIPVGVDLPDCTVETVPVTTTVCRYYGQTVDEWAFESHVSTAVGIPLIVLCLVVLVVVNVLGRR